MNGSVLRDLQETAAEGFHCRKVGNGCGLGGVTDPGSVSTVSLKPDTKECVFILEIC